MFFQGKKVRYRLFSPFLYVSGFSTQALSCTYTHPTFLVLCTLRTSRYGSAVTRYKHFPANTSLQSRSGNVTPWYVSICNVIDLHICQCVHGAFNELIPMVKFQFLVLLIQPRVNSAKSCGSRCGFIRNAHS